MTRYHTRSALAALLLLLLAAGFPTPAAAHLYLVSSEPAEGAHLTTAPREIRLTFSQPVELAFTQVQLMGPDGSPVRLSEPLVSGGEASVLVLRIEDALGPGPYSVVWQTTSADGHPVRGRIGFSIDENAEGLAEAVADEPAAPSPLHHDPAVFPAGDGFTAGAPGYVVVRWLVFVGLLGVIGVATFKLLVLGMVRRRRVPEGVALLAPATARSANLGLTFSLLLVLAVLARLYAQSLALHGSAEALSWTSISAMLARTTWGWGWLLQAAATAVALLGFAIARHRSRAHTPETAAAGGDAAPTVLEPRERSGPGPGDDSVVNAGWILAAIGALALAFTPALAGHAAATPGPTVLAVLSDGMHVFGAGGWLGSLLVVFTIGIPVAMQLGRERRGRAVAVLVNAFSPTALFFAAIVTVTGVFSASLHLGSFADLWKSEYGRVLLVKLGVLLLVFGTGAYNYRRVKPTLGDDEGAQRMRRSAGFELVVGTAVLLVTAVLVATPPPVHTAPPAEHAAVGESP